MERAISGDYSVWASAAEHTSGVALRYQTQRLNLYRIAQERWPPSVL